MRIEAEGEERLGLGEFGARKKERDAARHQLEGCVSGEAFLTSVACADSCLERLCVKSARVTRM